MLGRVGVRLYSLQFGGAVYMSVYDYLLLLIIAVWVVLAVIYIIKSRKISGCSACCRNCRRTQGQQRRSYTRQTGIGR